MKVVCVGSSCGASGKRQGVHFVKKDRGPMAMAMAMATAGTAMVASSMGEGRAWQGEEQAEATACRSRRMAEGMSAWPKAATTSPQQGAAGQQRSQPHMAHGRCRTRAE